MKNLLIALLAITVTACVSSRGFDRGVLRDEISDRTVVVTEDDIKKALAARPQLPRPFKLAIHFVPPKIPAQRYGESWKWLADDKHKMLQIGTELKAKGIISDVFLLNEAIVDGPNNRSIRLAAAHLNADAVLIINGTHDIDLRTNAWVYSYFLLVPYFFAPAVDIECLFLANASLWDVRNQLLYLSVDTEGTAKEARTLLFAYHRVERLVDMAKSDVLAAIAKELTTRLVSMDAK